MFEKGDNAMIPALGKIFSRFISFSPPGLRNRNEEDTNIPRRSVQPTVVESFKMVIEDSRFEVLVPRLNAVDFGLRGFAYEGAGLGLMILDCLLPWKNRLKAFASGPGALYAYALHLGAGLALARLNKRPERYFARLDPFLCWVAIDGYGFYQVMFSRQRTLEEKVVPAHLSDYARHVFDQGVGRGFWFLTRGNTDALASAIASFPSSRQADLWAGVGYACAYGGGIMDPAFLESFQTAAGPYRSQLALVAALAAAGRQRVGNQAPHTDLACEIWCGLSSERAANITNIARQGLPTDGVEPAHKLWRQRIEANFAVPTTPQRDSKIDVPQ